MPLGEYRGSDYTHHYFPEKPNLLFVVDQVSPGHASVTNDAERVVAAMLRHPEADGASTRIIYRDSDGGWDELRHDGARFIGFAPLTDIERQTLAPFFARVG